MAEKNELVGQGENQVSPYKAKGSDFSVTSVKADKTQSGGAKGMAEGKNQLASQSWNQHSPRDNESVGPNGPSEWGKGGRGFTVGQNESAGTSVDNPCSVDLKTGQVECKGYKETKVHEVPDRGVSIG